MKRRQTQWGRGSTQAVFLHGFAGSSGTFAHLEPYLGDVLSAHCLELPGHAGMPTVETWDEAVELVAAQVPEGSVVVGYSQGARLALAVALRYPRRVARLVLESGAAGFRRRHDRLLRRKADEALADLIVSRGVEAFVAHWEQLPLFAGLRSLPLEEQLALRDRRGNQSAEGLAGALKAMGQGAQPDLWPGLPGLRIPTLLLTGALDAKYTRLARKMTAEIPLAWRATFPDVGHAPHLECPEAWVREVKSFLAPHWGAEPQVHAP